MTMARGAVISVLASALLAAPAMVAPAMAAPPSISNEYKATTLEFAACMARAKETLTAAGFGRIQTGSYSTFGTQGEYSAIVRCVTEKTIVVIVTAGPVGAECSRLGTQLKDLF